MCGAGNLGQPLSATDSQSKPSSTEQDPHLEAHTFHSIGDDTDGTSHPLLQPWPILVAHSEVVEVWLLWLMGGIELGGEEGGTQSYSML